MKIFQIYILSQLSGAISSKWSPEMLIGVAHFHWHSMALASSIPEWIFWSHAQKNLEITDTEAHLHLEHIVKKAELNGLWWLVIYWFSAPSFICHCCFIYSFIFPFILVIYSCNKYLLRPHWMPGIVLDMKNTVIA